MGCLFAICKGKIKKSAKKCKWLAFADEWCMMIPMATKKRPRYRKLSPRVWSDLLAAIVNGTETASSQAVAYDVPYRTVKYRYDLLKKNAPAVTADMGHVTDGIGGDRINDTTSGSATTANEEN